MPGVRLPGARAVGNELKWGRPPGLRGTPWSRFSFPAFLVCVALTGALVSGGKVPEGDGGVARRPGCLPHFSGVALLLKGLQQFLALLSLLGGMALCKAELSLRYAVRRPPVRRAIERFHAFGCPGAESFVGNSAWYKVLRESGNLLICNVEVVVETRNSETLLPPDFCQRHP